ncbi:MAG: hypothetical protein WCV56_08820 [Candidatus Omnitrophota bacterium]
MRKISFSFPAYTKVIPVALVKVKFDVRVQPQRYKGLVFPERALDDRAIK